MMPLRIVKISESTVIATERYPISSKGIIISGLSTCFPMATIFWKR